jgi:hypothetical protein
MPFPEGFRFSSCGYRSALAVFGHFTWSLNVVMAMKCRGRRLQCWSISAPECRMPWDIFNYSKPAYIERSWRRFDVLARRPGVFFLVKRREGTGERGSNSFFAQKFGKFYLFDLWTKKIQLWLPSSMLPAFLTLSLLSTVALGLNVECSFSWKVSLVESSIIHMVGTCITGKWQDRYVLPHFLSKCCFHSFKCSQCSLDCQSWTKDLQDGPVDQGMPTGVARHQRRYARYFYLVNFLWASIRSQPLS